MASVAAIVFAASAGRLPDGIERWLTACGIAVVRLDRADQVMDLCQRSRPRIVLVDARSAAARSGLELVGRLKGDAYLAVIPTVVVTDEPPASIEAALTAGADEALTATHAEGEVAARLTATVRRSDRDVQVHPSTRLPGAAAIEMELKRRIEAGQAFAACYADLDYFKEFNDRYSYYQGDRVIRIVSQILHDVVVGVCGQSGFVGHIGGDDFIFIIPIDPIGQICGEIITVFDDLIPLQYSDHDRRAGYFFGKDRRGQLHRVSLMTLSIGVVTTERRRFTHAAQVSALATEMKSYAKTLPGSVYSIDRRKDESSDDGSRRSGPIRLVSPPTRGGATS